MQGDKINAVQNTANILQIILITFRLPEAETMSSFF